MAVMFRLNQAALLFTQLLVMWNSRIVFAGPAKEDHTIMLVSRGDSVMLTCNISTDPTLICWTKGSSVFTYSISLNRTFSNFSFHRLKINHESPSKLIIFSAQPEDEGLYTCNITDRRGLNSITWNLTVILKETISLEDFPYIFPPAIGFLLCSITVAVFFRRKIMRKTLNQDPVQTPAQPGETALPQPQGGTAHWKNNKRRSQYMERLNIIYDQF